MAASRESPAAVRTQRSHAPRACDDRRGVAGRSALGQPLGRGRDRSRCRGVSDPALNRSGPRWASRVGHQDARTTRGGPCKSIPAAPGEAPCTRGTSSPSSREPLGADRFGCLQLIELSTARRRDRCASPCPQHDPLDPGQRAQVTHVAVSREAQHRESHKRRSAMSTRADTRSSHGHRGRAASSGYHRSRNVPPILPAGHPGAHSPDLCRSCQAR
jgi:hypothetical protein